ncbi:MAG: EAL domain-containing protein [Pseudomonadales bacterium]|nr:EAL domain-containing protein [Pseudomonadales bacterium]
MAGSWLRELIIPALLALSLGVLVEQTLERSWLRSLQRNEQEVVTSQLSNYRYQLESLVTNTLSVLNGLAAFIGSNPDFTQAQFDAYAATVIAREPSLVNLAVAPDLVVRYVYPLQNNTQALGLDYRATPDQFALVQRVLESGGMVVAGPLELIQGGLAFIGRAPVYIDDVATGSRRFWGIVSAPIFAENVYRAVGLLDPELPFRIAIRGQDGSGSSGSVFFGDPAVFEAANAVSMPVSVGGGEWMMAATPWLDVTAGRGEVILFRFLMGLATCLLLLTGLLIRQQYKRDKDYRKIIFRNERFLREVEAVSLVGGWRLSPDGIFIEVSAQGRQILLLPADKKPVSIDDLGATLAEESQHRLKQLFRDFLSAPQDFTKEVNLRHVKGEALWLLLKGDVQQTSNSRFEIIGTVQDITQAKFNEGLIEYQANYDGLTGLPNRGLFQDRLQTALAQSARKHSRLAVLFIDLDNFKLVNDNLGHDAGDKMLILVAERIRSCLRETDTIARYSGDEFTVILADIPNNGVVERVAAKIVDAMTGSFLLNANQVYCGVSLGIALYPEDGQDVETLVTKADQAMYEVKKAGRNSWQFYTLQMQIESEHKHRLYNALVDAVNQQQLQVFYQPIFDVRDDTIVGCEALVRWQDAAGNWVPPDEFIPIAEERGLINKVDCQVLDVASAAIAALNQKLGITLELSVNISARLLYLRDDSARKWLSMIKSLSGLPLVVEITERVLIDESLDAGILLNELTRSGVSICLDDFGIGYSGLSYFALFPVKRMKIDRSFISQIGQSETQESLIESMLLMAEKLDIRVVGEGVETAAQKEFLQLQQCHLLQGYFLARPMPITELEEFVQAHLRGHAQV